MLPKTKEVLDFIANDELFKKYDIRFVGGTALSYLINHRLSEDLDFATLILEPYQVEEIEEMIKKYGGEKLEHNITMEEYTLNDGEDIDLIYIKFMINGVKIEFFTPPFNLAEVSVWKNDKYTYYGDTTLKVASLNTIIYMKTMAFWNRKKYRDLFDIYYVIENKHISAHDFIMNYLEHNITHSTSSLYKNIQSPTLFFKKTNDEGIHTLVTNPKTYDWYRTKIEEFIHGVLLDELYSSF